MKSVPCKTSKIMIYFDFSITAILSIIWICCYIDGAKSAAIQELVTPEPQKGIECWNCGYVEDSDGKRIEIPQRFLDGNVTFCDDFADPHPGLPMTKVYPNVSWEKFDFLPASKNLNHIFFCSIWIFLYLQDTCCSSFKIKVEDKSNPDKPSYYWMSRHGGASDFDEMQFNFKCPAAVILC